MMFHQTTIAVALSVALSGETDAFAFQPASRVAPRSAPLYSAVIEEPATVANGVTALSESPKSWDCDEEATCVEIEACDEEDCRTSLDVRIHGDWYDLTGWRKAHPAGAHWIDWYDGRDATEVMDAFHSEKGRSMYKRLPKSKPDTASVLEASSAPYTQTELNFRELRAELEADGWWERDFVHEATLLAIYGGLVIGAAVTAESAPPVATILLGLSMTQAGWLGHDYIHGVDKFADTMRPMAAVGGGLGPTWWSDKHNKHHALTNEVGVDEDLATDPFLFMWAPDPEHDSPLRKIQHLIFYVPFSFLFALWRIDTMKVVIESIEEKRPEAKKEIWYLLSHYAILLTLFSPAVWMPAVLLSGFLSATIVTPTHQSEEYFDEYQPDWVTAQFESTRNAVTTNPFSEWMWGGMQYQLELHLFPTMPRSKYPLLKPILQKFVEENNVPGGYRESGEFEILKMNWDLYKKVAESDPVPGAPYSRGHGQLGAIDFSGGVASGSIIPF